MHFSVYQDKNQKAINLENKIKNFKIQQVKENDKTYDFKKKRQYFPGKNGLG